MGRTSKCIEETQAFSGQWILCHEPVTLFSWLCRGHKDSLQNNFASGVASCELAWSGLKSLSHIEEVQQGNLMRSFFKNKKVGEGGGGGMEAEVARSHK